MLVRQASTDPHPINMMHTLAQLCNINRRFDLLHLQIAIRLTGSANPSVFYRFLPAGGSAVGLNDLYTAPRKSLIVNGFDMKSVPEFPG